MPAPANEESSELITWSNGWTSEVCENELHSRLIRRKQSREILVCSCSCRLSNFASRLGGGLNLPSDLSFYHGFVITVLACQGAAVQNLLFAWVWGSICPPIDHFTMGF